MPANCMLTVCLAHHPDLSSAFLVSMDSHPYAAYVEVEFPSTFGDDSTTTYCRLCDFECTVGCKGKC